MPVAFVMNETVSKGQWRLAIINSLLLFAGSEGGEGGGGVGGLGVGWESASGKEVV